MKMRSPLTASLIALLCAAPLAAATSDTHSYKVCGRAYSDQAPFAWKNVSSRYRPLLETQGLTAAGKKLLDDLKDSPRQKDRASLTAFVAKATEVLDSGKPCCTQFTVLETVDDTDYSRRLSLLDDSVSLNDCGTDNVRAEQLDELRYVADDFEQLGRIQVSPFQALGVKAIQEKSDEYDRMLFHGFPEFPWEALVNGALMTDKDIAKGPPLDQLVLFHPSAGAEMQVGLRESKLAASLAVEPFGWVHYPRDSKHRTWWGVSALTTFRNDMGLGVGAAARYQNFMAGVLWHDSDNDKRLFNTKPFVFVGVDLYQFAGQQLRRYETVRDRVTSTLKADASTPR
ncbi:MAG: hypothetical protein HY077_11335 [Elusimicrobia bacterium]|nr:hypothetical protein [Elusimicrobiota bacterium]